MLKLNPWQAAAMRAYCGGDFEYLTVGEYDETDIQNAGDTLLLFLVRKLGDAGDAREAKKFMQRAISELLEVYAALPGDAP